MAQLIASGSTSNGLGYSSRREIDTTEQIHQTVATGGKGEDDLEIRIEFGLVHLYLLLVFYLHLCSIHKTSTLSIRVEKRLLNIC